MATFLRVFVLVKLCIVVHASFAIGAPDVEVSLAIDGSVIDENRPLQAVASGASQDTQMQSRVTVPQPTESVDASMEIKKPVNMQEESDVVALMTTLQQELEAVEQMVTFQEKKLQVLGEMRRVWLQEHQEIKIQEETRVTTRRPRVDIAEMIERRLEAAVAESGAEATARSFDMYFVEKQSIQLEGEVADMKMMKIRATSAVELVAVAYRDGVVVFSTSGAEELLRVNTEKKGIKAIVLESQDDQPCLVVTYEAPVVAIYRLNVVEKRNSSADVGKGSQNSKSDQPLTFTISIGSDYLLSVSEHRELQLSAKASAVTIARSSRQLVVAVAQVDGIVDFFALNGTSLRQMQTNASISAMGTRRNLLAFSNGADVVISSMTRAQGSVFHTCPGSSANVSSIAFDAVQSEVMYAGTQRGEILVYAVNVGAPAESQVCRLLSRSTVSKSPRGASSVSLTTTKMYVIAASYEDIAVFNVSKTQRNGVSLSRICSSRLSKPIKPTEGHQLNLLTMAFSEGTMGSHLAIITAGNNGQSKLALFHSLLPDESETSDFQWTAIVYAGVVIIAVIGSQLFIRWQKQTSVNPWDSLGKAHDMPYGKYGGLKDHEASSEFDGEDFGRYNSLSDELRRKIAQAKKGAAHRPIDDDANY